MNKPNCLAKFCRARKNIQQFRLEKSDVSQKTRIVQTRNRKF